MELTFEEAVEYLEDGITVTLDCDSGSYDIDLADNFIGGEGMEGYISMVLGNVVYDSAEHVLEKSIKYLEKQGETVEITG